MLLQALKSSWMNLPTRRRRKAVAVNPLLYTQKAEIMLVALRSADSDREMK